MQIADIPNGAFPPGGNAPTPDIALQLRKQRREYKRILTLRTVGFWWYRILLVVLASYAAAILGQLGLDFPKEVFGGIIVLVIFFLAVRRLEFGLLVTAILATAFLPKAFSLKSLDVYTVLHLLLLLFFVVISKIAFYVKRFVLPLFSLI